MIVGVAPNGVVTYVSNLYPGSISDKAIVQQSGFLNHLTAGDMVLADKGFVIQDLVPNSVSVSIYHHNFAWGEGSGLISQHKPVNLPYSVRL